MAGKMTATTRTVGVKLTDTTFRDAQQSLLATRMKTEDMLAIAADLDSVGFRSLEVWGGATFDVCLRYLNEDPWERLTQLRRLITKTPLQMLLRGQNLVGYRHFADDVVEEFVRRAAGNGIDIIRVFDALNDTRNMAKAIETGKKAGAHIQGTVVYTISPVHNLVHYLRTAQTLAAMGADSICIKDMAGLLTPGEATRLIQGIKARVGLPVQLHCHYSSGLAGMTYLKAVEAGVDTIDTAFSSMAMESSLPAAETMVAALAGSPRDTGLDMRLLVKISAYFREVRKKYGAYDAHVGIDPGVLSYQIPGGMISNLVAQLSQQGAASKLQAVLEEVPRVRADLGYPPLVTPTSQIVGTQAVLNVLTGERYKIVSNEVKSYLRGLYGRPPGEVNPELQRCLGGGPVVVGRPADNLEPQLSKARREIAYYMNKEEDVLSYVLFPNVAKTFLQERLAAETGVDYALAESSTQEEESKPSVKYYPA